MAQQPYPWASLVEAIPQFRFPFPFHVKNCQKLTSAQYNPDVCRGKQKLKQPIAMNGFLPVCLLAYLLTYLLTYCFFAPG